VGWLGVYGAKPGSRRTTFTAGAGDPNSSVVAAYVASLTRGEGTIRAGTLSRRLAALAWAHKIAGELDPTRDAVRALLRSARRHLGTAPVHRKAAITPDMLVAMLELCPPTGDGERDAPYGHERAVRLHPHGEPDR
jgi:hypothetical protein